MILTNARNKVVISNNAKLATSFFDRLFGLLDHRNPRTLIFYTRFGIHTLFLKEAIDVIILDRQDIICKIKAGIEPFRFFIYNPKYFKVVELPKGTIEINRLCVGDKILIA